MATLVPASTSYLLYLCDKDVDGRDKPGHDGRPNRQPSSLPVFAFTAIAAAAVRFSTPSFE
jgi:hypothetical protein